MNALFNQRIKKLKVMPQACGNRDNSLQTPHIALLAADQFAVTVYFRENGVTQNLPGIRYNAFGTAQYVLHSAPPIGKTIREVTECFLFCRCARRRGIAMFLIDEVFATSGA